MPTMYEGFGVEAVMHDVSKSLVLNLNDEIIVVDSKAVERDEEWAELTDVDYVPIVCEPVPNTHYHKGSIPSFIQTADRLADYPGVAIVAGRIAPDPENASADQFDVYQNYVSVHGFVKATDEEGANIAAIRATRLVEAIYRVIRVDTGLRLKLMGTSAPMQAMIAEPWAFPPEDGSSENVWWCIGGVEFQIKNRSYVSQ